MTRFAPGAGLDQPIGLAFDAKGYLFAANDNGSSMARISPLGRILPFAPDPRYHFRNGIVFLPKRKSVEGSQAGREAKVGSPGETFPSTIIRLSEYPVC